MKQILATFPLRNFLRVFALVAVVSATSCSKDPAVDGELHGDMLRFAVAEADGWNTQLRCGAAESEEKSAVSPENVAEVFSLRGENPADTLFLHASVADTESPHRTRMCKPTDCRRVPRPSKRGPFTIRSAYWLRFIRGLGARIPACRIICTMSK